MTAAEQIIERYWKARDRFDVADQCGSIEWATAAHEECEHHVRVLRLLLGDRESAGLTVDLNVQIVALDARSWEAERRMRGRLADPETRERVLQAVERALNELADSEGDL